MHQKGFSLIELLMGLAIAGIVLHLVSPAFAALTESNHREEAAQSLVSGIRSARSEAITRNQTTVIHGINNDWGQGWRTLTTLSSPAAYASGESSHRQHLIMAPNLTDVSGPRIHTRPVAGLPLIHVETPRYEGGKLFAKRVFDIIGSVAVLVILSVPLLVIFI